MWNVMLALVWLAGAQEARTAAGGAGRAMTLDDFFKLGRLSDARISPDGKHVAYVVSDPSLVENRYVSNIWIVDVASGTASQLTRAPKRDRRPRWSPDGKYMMFESNRTGETQLWVLPVAGGEARQITQISTEASSGVWSPDGHKIAFVSGVWPEYSDKPFAQSDELNRKRKEEKEKNPVKAKVFSRLFYRHWDDYVEDRRQHIFVIDVDPATSEIPEPRDITPGDRDAFPTSSTFSGGDDYTFSPNGEWIVLTAVPVKDEAWNTRHELCRVSVRGGEAAWPALGTGSTGAEGAPVFSPDGKSLAFRAQRRAGFEADRWELFVAPCLPDGTLAGQAKSLSQKLDRSIDALVFTADGKLIAQVEENAGHALYSFAPGQEPARICGPVGMLGSLSVDAAGKVLAMTEARMNRPAEVAVVELKATAPLSPRLITRHNAPAFAGLSLPQPESLSVPVEGATMQMWLLKPPGFDPAKKWPLVYLVHGGPQGAWEDGWSWRWNPSLWAAQGYVVACPNPRGSTGFGQKFVDDISGDWGGKCYRDLMAGMDTLEKLPYIDKERMASAGASFGGYMMNWFQGNTTRFKTLITHCGVYNFDSMYATTEELWFDEWEHGGPPWGPNRNSYEKHSPHRLAANFKTPMLIIHNDLDFRVPVSEGHQLFTTLQRLGVPSKFINFPDEGHWVVKPRNSEYWHKEVFAWLARYAPPGAR
jgi:dipeptidyl aminopeptidase/acylaminoacyl peptidase